MLNHHYIGKTAQVVFMLVKLKELLLDSNTFKLMSVFYKKKTDNGIFVPKYEKYGVMPADMCNKLRSGPLVVVLNKLLGSDYIQPLIQNYINS